MKRKNKAEVSSSPICATSSRVSLWFLYQELILKSVSETLSTKESFEKYLRQEITLLDIAEKDNITYESAQQKIHKIRLKVKKQVIGFMDGKGGCA